MVALQDRFASFALFALWFVTEMSVVPAERVVDAWWAAHAAARRLEKNIQVVTEARHNPTGQSVVITVRTHPLSVPDPSLENPPIA